MTDKITRSGEITTKAAERNPAEEETAEDKLKRFTAKLAAIAIAGWVTAAAALVVAVVALVL